MSGRVGVISIQGDFEKHLLALKRRGIEGIEVRTPEDLRLVERVILPGGESTTVGLLMQRFGLGEALIDAAKAGMPMWGTCMGAILLAREIEGSEQYRLGVMDLAVRRNAFGAQVHSFEASVEVSGFDRPVMGVFIRAPIFTSLGAEVQELARFEGHVVAARQGALLATSFHPELLDETRFHEFFLTVQA